MTDIHTDEIKSRVELKVAKPDKHFTFQKAAENRILEGKTTDTGFVVVMGRYAMTYGRTSLLPYLIARFGPVTGTKTRLDVVIQPSLGSGLIILSIVYILAAVAIYVSWTKSNVQGIVVPSLLIVVTYISMLLKFNREKKTYLDFIEKDILRN
ncbi:MAG TPA: hypothetical protein VEY06_00260 [Flavisolibacter sp.]|nr:hypothetical protein [Flavisolibacter sp.]